MTASAFKSIKVATAARSLIEVQRPRAADAYGPLEEPQAIREHLIRC